MVNMKSQVLNTFINQHACAITEERLGILSKQINKTMKFFNFSTYCDSAFHLVKNVAESISALSINLLHVTGSFKLNFCWLPL